MFDGPSIRKVLRDTTLDAVRAPGAVDAIVVGAGAT